MPEVWPSREEVQRLFFTPRFLANQGTLLRRVIAANIIAVKHLEGTFGIALLD